jgi:hypothetical protein
LRKTGGQPGGSVGTMSCFETVTLVHNTSGCSAFLPHKKRGLPLIDTLTCPSSDSASVYHHVERGTSRLADVRPPVFNVTIFAFAACQRRNPIFGVRYSYANQSFLTFFVDQVQTLVQQLVHNVLLIGD